jgi:Leucine-rich repeat (LRR) protein
MKRTWTVFIVLILSCFGNSSSAQADPFYIYGPSQEETFIDFDRASKKPNQVLKLKCHEFDLSQSFRKLSKFDQLYVASLLKNKLDSLPGELFDSPNLLYFQTANPLVKLPDNIGSATRLKHLKIYQTALLNLPISMQRLSSLQSFELQLNASDSLDVDSALYQLPSLEKILMYKVNLNEFPPLIHTCKRLEDISLVDCNIQNLDSCLLNFPNLKKLNLNDNKITSIDKCILNCAQLEELNLKGNKLKELPEYLHYLRNLKVIDISGNNIPMRDVTILRILMPQTKIIF